MPIPPLPVTPPQGVRRTLPRAPRWLAALALVLVTPAVALAQGAGGPARPAAQGDTLPRPVMRPLRLSGAPGDRISIDGRLDEGAWARAVPATGWVQAQPNTGAPESERSEARVLVDDQNVYVGYRMFDRRPDSIGVQLARRDVGDTFTDWVWVGFDSFGDRRTAFAFAISPRGAQRDGYVFNDTEFDIQWDAVWQSAARIDSLGWTAELRIPLSQLRYTAGDSTRTWGIQFLRELARRGENSYWSPRPPTQPGDASRFGTLAGLGAMKGALPLEVIPYVRAQATTAPVQPGNPFSRATDPEAAVGLDVRTRLPKSLTLTATVNPDFGQVEADPAVVNLSAFEVFFPERRPFFLEGFDAFRFGGTTTFNANDAPNFFYTRRIGRPPQRRPGGGDAAFVDVPRQTPILAALKLSGTTPGGWSIGSVNATTPEERGRFSTTDGAIAREPVEPLTNYHVTRVRKLMRGGYTSVGGFGSWVERRMGGAGRADTLFTPLLPGRALVGGLDFEHAWDQRRWTVSGVVSRSQVSGDPAAIARLQRANYRAFQRPDAAHLEFDPTRAALGGGYYALTAAKTAGRLTASVTAEQIDPGFESNDLGFQFRSDVRSVSTGTSYRQPARTRWFQSWSTGVFTTFSSTTAGDNLERRVASFNELQFLNFWTLSLEGNVESGRFSDRLLRGGPMAARPQSSRAELGVRTDPRRALIVGVGTEWQGDRAGRRNRGVGVELDWRPQPAVRLRLEPELSFNELVDQYVTARDDPLASTTFGRRYVFADVRQREARLNTRLDWTFSPYVSLQLFVQPFASVGRFLRYKEFLTPRRFDFATYGEQRGTVVRDGRTVRIDPDGAAGPAATMTVGEQDYTARELRGNAVLRWELRPGSALFFVWQQNRDAFATGADDLDAAGQLGALGGVPARNVFLVKLAWWVGR